MNWTRRLRGAVEQISDQITDRTDGEPLSASTARIRPGWEAVLGDVRQIAADVVRVNDPHREHRLQDHADTMFNDLVQLGGAMADSADRMASLVPGYRLAARQARRAEAALLREVKRRIEDVAATQPSGEQVDPRMGMLAELLNASLDTDPSRSQQQLHLRILRQMLPDEARILAALSDGTRFALIHVQSRMGGRPVLENACTVGRVAAVHVMDAVPVYVGHLRELGLAEEGPADDRLSDQYALLTSEDLVQQAIVDAESGIKTVRRTLRISRLGSELWAACTNQQARTPDPSRVNGNGYQSAYAGAPPRSGKRTDR
jgi:hypothetical protein